MAEDEDEWGLFISCDGIRLSAPWRLDDYGHRGALNQEQIEKLAAQFSFKADDLDQLSLSIGRSLDSATPLYVAVKRSKATTRAKKELASSLTDISAACDKVANAIDRLAPLYPDVHRDQEGAEIFIQARQRLGRCAAKFDELEDMIHSVTKRADYVLVLEPPDKRVIPDERRRSVLTSIFQFWYEFGPKRRYTTGIVTPGRSGPLIEFANAIVACVTEPPSQLSGDTIVDDFRSFTPMTQEFYEAFEAAFKRPQGSSES